jgi:hypothetical protein
MQSILASFLKEGHDDDDGGLWDRPGNPIQSTVHFSADFADSLKLRPCT